MTPVFVFGSNLAGRHGAGAALFARRYRGAVYGVGEGPQGSAYAIPTKGRDLRPLPLWQVERAVNRFLTYARERPGVDFQLTAIGCGLAGFRRDQIEPLFSAAPGNVIPPPEWAFAG